MGIVRENKEVKSTITKPTDIYSLGWRNIIEEWSVTDTCLIKDKTPVAYYFDTHSSTEKYCNKNDIVGFLKQDILVFSDKYKGGFILRFFTTNGFFVSPVSEDIEDAILDVVISDGYVHSLIKDNNGQYAISTYELKVGELGSYHMKKLTSKLIQTDNITLDRIIYDNYGGNNVVVYEKGKDVSFKAYKLDDLLK